MRHNQKVYVLLVAFVLYHLFRTIHGQKLSQTDLSALLEIKNSLTEIPTSTSEFFSTWDFNSPDPCSTFSGLICSSTMPRRVISLSLGTGLSDSPGLSGSLSPSILELSELTQIVLFSGIVTGPIPPLIGNLKKLRVISLTQNRISGTIPSSICSLPELHTLDLSSNLLTSQLPYCIWKLASLRVMVVSSNTLTGKIPPELPQSLFHLDLKNNDLYGLLPDRMPLSLRYLSASRNKLTGPLTPLESLSELVYLDLSMNMFSGPIPPPLFRPALTTMLLQRNNFTGGLPVSETCYGPGSTVDLSHNSLTGDLTAIFSGVETLFLNNNQFRGDVPEEYVHSLEEGTTTTLYLQHNYFSSFPLDSDMPFPDSASLCLSYNCFWPSPVGFAACPSSSGTQLSRPTSQCHAQDTSNQIFD